MSEPRRTVAEQLDAAREVWAEIPGYEGLYEASDQGRVRSVDRLVGKYGKKRVRGRELKFTWRNGYAFVCLSNQTKAGWAVHRLVLLAFVGPLPKGQVTRHLNGNRGDNRLVNLVYGTYSENLHDAIRHGTHSESSKTHCPQGHEYNEGNTYRYPISGNRRCRTCAHAKKMREAAEESRRRRLSHQMRAAADVLEQASQLYDAFDPTTYTWSAKDLRREAEHVESEEVA